MQDKAGVDQKASVAELIALLRKVQEELEAHGDLNGVNLLLRDLAREDRGSKNVCRDFSPNVIRLLLDSGFIDSVSLNRAGKSAGILCRI